MYNVHIHLIILCLSRNTIWLKLYAWAHVAHAALTINVFHFLIRMLKISRKILYVKWKSEWRIATTHQSILMLNGKPLANSQKRLVVGVVNALRSNIYAWVLGDFSNFSLQNTQHELSSSFSSLIIIISNAASSYFILNLCFREYSSWWQLCTWLWFESMNVSTFH